MSYRAGIGPGLGIPPGEPHIYCDKCGRTAPVTPANAPGLPYKWFLNGKAKPGWAGGSNADHTRWDLCPDCKPK